MTRAGSYQRGQEENTTRSGGGERRVDVAILAEMTEKNARATESLASDFREGMGALTTQLHETTLIMRELTVEMRHVKEQSIEHANGRRELEGTIRAVEVTLAKRLATIENWQSAIKGSIRTWTFMAGGLSVVIPACITILARYLMGG